MSEQVLVGRDALERLEAICPLLEEAGRLLLAQDAGGVIKILQEAHNAIHYTLALSAPAEAGKAERQWRHEKSGNTYHEVCRAHLCVSDAQPNEGDEVVIYRSAEGLLWAREDQDFRRRFAALAPAQPPEVEAGAGEVEIINPQGRVAYRRPLGHPDVLEALQRPGYSVRKAEAISDSNAKLK